MASYIGVLNSAARTTNESKVINVWEKYTAAHIVVDITAGNSPLLVSVKGKDSVSGKTYVILSSLLQSNSGTTVLKIAPEYTAAANVAKDYLPYTTQIDVSISGGTTATYSLGVSLI